MIRLTEEKRINLLQEEMKLSQDQIDKYDNILERVSTWAVTLWVASLGWSFQVSRKEFILLNIVIVLVFWILSGINKSFRQDYKARRNEISHLLNKMGKEGVTADEIISPRFPSHANLWKNTLGNMFQTHSGLVYILLIIVSGVIYLRF